MVRKGIMYGISPDGSLDSTSRDDTAYYYGVRLDVKEFKKWFGAWVKTWNS